MEICLALFNITVNIISLAKSCEPSGPLVLFFGLITMFQIHFYFFSAVEFIGVSGLLQYLKNNVGLIDSRVYRNTENRRPPELSYTRIQQSTPRIKTSNCLPSIF